MGPAGSTSPQGPPVSPGATPLQRAERSRMPRAVAAGGFVMNTARRLHLIVAAMLLIGLCSGAPTFAQGDEAAALNARVLELFRAGKYADAIRAGAARAGDQGEGARSRASRCRALA